MSSETMELTKEESSYIEEDTVETHQKQIKKTEVYFGVIMAITALSAIWGAVSLLIELFVAG